jgi:hypothetical protein
MEGEDKKREQTRKRPHRVHVRFSPEEWVRLCREEVLLGNKKAKILRDAYFSRSKVTLLMDKEGVQKFLAEFNRIGNNINQLAKKANSGGLVSDSALTLVREQFATLFSYVMRFNGLR